MGVKWGFPNPSGLDFNRDNEITLFYQKIRFSGQVESGIIKRFLNSPPIVMIRINHSTSGKAS
jgi:hypothetical protein